MLRNERGEARKLLVQIISLSPDDPVARRNLTVVLKGARSELAEVLGDAGDIRQRLLGGTPLHELQNQFDLRMPSWRAFVGDFEELELVKCGLPAHEDPSLRKRLLDLEKLLSSGKIDEALEEWDELGQPVAAASGIITQVFGGLGSLEESVEHERWPQAKRALDDLKNIVKTEDDAKMNPGLERHLGRMESLIRWHQLLQEAERPASLDAKLRQKHLENLIKVRDEIQLASDWIGDKEELEQRVDAAIDRCSATVRLPPSGNGASTRWFLFVILILAAAVIAAWYYFGGAIGSPSVGLDPSRSELVPEQFVAQ